MIKELENKKCIFFDVGYTLDKPASGDWLFTNKFYEFTNEKLILFSDEQIKTARNAGIKYIMKNHLTLTIDEEIDRFIHFYGIINSELKLGLSDEQISIISIDRATNMNNYIIYDDSIEVCSELKKHFKLGIISDTWPSIENQLKHIGVYDLFDTYTYSCSLGVFKPDEKMFLDALRKSGCEPKDCVFIDDSINNLEGAYKLGITPILIAANKASDVETRFKKIYSLSELIK